MTIRPVGAEMFHADGQTDRHDEANSCRSQFANTPNKSTTHYSYSVVFCNWILTL